MSSKSFYRGEKGDEGSLIFIQIKGKMKGGRTLSRSHSLVPAKVASNALYLSNRAATLGASPWAMAHIVAFEK